MITFNSLERVRKAMELQEAAIAQKSSTYIKKPEPAVMSRREHESACQDGAAA
ncbi:MAG: hypothetical protein GY801_37985 [bacterium]|nr:hypothetical protein [bacterium]